MKLIDDLKERFKNIKLPNFITSLEPKERNFYIGTGVATLLVLLLLGHGIVRHGTNEYQVYRLGYTGEQARMISESLSQSQIDTLLARQSYDANLIELITQRYFIADNLERYIAYHEKDTTIEFNDVVAVVNVQADREWYTDPVPCDTALDTLMLVNKFHYLDENYKPANLVKFHSTYAYAGNQALKVVVDNFIKMEQAVKEECDGAHLMVNSSYRSYNHQGHVGKHKQDKYAARRGFSEHQTGLSIDITSQEHPVGKTFGESKEGKWLKENCHKYGFIIRYPEGKSHITGYNNEPWHLRYVGVETATRIYNKRITFDEYYAYYIERK